MATHTSGLSTTPRRRGLFEAFTAVDLVTIAAFAAAWRLTHLTQKFLNFAFPLNVALWMVYYAWGLAAVLVLVPKPGTVALYSTLGVLAINLLLEGDPPQWLITIPPAILITELIFLAIYKRTGNYGNTPQTAMLGLTLSAPFWWLAVIYFGLEHVFATPFTMGGRILTFLGFMVAAPVFGYIGNKIGEGVRPLLTH